MNRIFLLPVLLIPLFIQTPIFADNWSLSKQLNGIDVYTSKSQTAKLKSFKGTMILEGKLTQLVSAIDDTSHYTELFHNCKSAKELSRNSPNHANKYIVTSMPWPIKNRDMVVQSIILQNKKTKRVIINLTSKPDLQPLKSNLVRIQKMTGRWVLTPLKDNLIKVVYEMTVDPAGNLPKWLVNSISVDIPYYTLDNLRKRVSRKAYSFARPYNIIN